MSTTPYGTITHCMQELQENEHCKAQCNIFITHTWKLKTWKTKSFPIYSQNLIFQKIAAHNPSQMCMRASFTTCVLIHAKRHTYFTGVDKTRRKSDIQAPTYQKCTAPTNLVIHTKKYISPSLSQLHRLHIPNHNAPF